jgi:hypothetical protein
MPFTGPRTAPALGLRAGGYGAFIVPQTKSSKESHHVFLLMVGGANGEKASVAQEPFSFQALH